MLRTDGGGGVDVEHAAASRGGEKGAAALGEVEREEEEDGEGNSDGEGDVSDAPFDEQMLRKQMLRGAALAQSSCLSMRHEKHQPSRAVHMRSVCKAVRRQFVYCT